MADVEPITFHVCQCAQLFAHDCIYKVRICFGCVFILWISIIQFSLVVVHISISSSNIKNMRELFKTKIKENLASQIIIIYVG